MAQLIKSSLCLCWWRDVLIKQTSIDLFFLFAQIKILRFWRILSSRITCSREWDSRSFALCSRGTCRSPFDGREKVGPESPRTLLSLSRTLTSTPIWCSPNCKGATLASIHARPPIPLRPLALLLSWMSKVRERV